MPGDKYNTVLAILAYRMMYFETHPTAECYQLVWQPIDDCLQALARANPSYVTCLHSRSYTEFANEDPQQIDIHAVGLNQHLLLLGTASTRQAAIDDWWDQISSIATVSGFPPGSLAWSGAGALRRDFCGSIIPIDADELLDDQLKLAARRALNRYEGLTNVPIRWLDDASAFRLYVSIYREAERTAHPPTEAEQRLIIQNEYREP